MIISKSFEIKFFFFKKRNADYDPRLIRIQILHFVEKNFKLYFLENGDGTIRRFIKRRTGLSLM